MHCPAASRASRIRFPSTAFQARDCHFLSLLVYDLVISPRNVRPLDATSSHSSNLSVFVCPSRATTQQLLVHLEKIFIPVLNACSTRVVPSVGWCCVKELFNHKCHNYVSSFGDGNQEGFGYTIEYRQTLFDVI